jgi:hypothetical protein
MGMFAVAKYPFELYTVINTRYGPSFRGAMKSVTGKVLSANNPVSGGGPFG